MFQTESGFVDLITAVSGQEPAKPWLATRERLAKHVEGMFDERELSSSAHEVESFLEQFKKGETSGATASISQGDARQKWERLQRDELSSVPRELRVWVEEMLEELKQLGLFVSPKGGFAGWLPSDPPTADREVAFAKSLQQLHRGECPPDLKAFVTDVLAHVQARALPSRAARTRPSG
jgi:hypothetical protein